MKWSLRTIILHLWSCSCWPPSLPFTLTRRDGLLHSHSIMCGALWLSYSYPVRPRYKYTTHFLKNYKAFCHTTTYIFSKFEPELWLKSIQKYHPTVSLYIYQSSIILVNCSQSGYLGPLTTVLLAKVCLTIFTV